VFGQFGRSFEGNHYVRVYVFPVSDRVVRCGKDETKTCRSTFYLVLSLFTFSALALAFSAFHP